MKHAWIAVAVVALTACGDESTPSSAVLSSAPAAPVGVLVPLDMSPGTAWLDLADAKAAHPSVDVVAIVNPPPATITGPFVWSTGIAQLQTGHVRVLGRVDLQGGALPTTTATQAVEEWLASYGVDGIYFDNLPASPGLEAYVSGLAGRARRSGAGLVIGNGAGGAYGTYVSTVDEMVIHEGSSPASIGSLAAASSAYGASRVAVLVHSQPVFDAAWAQDASREVRHLYVTDGTAPTPYAMLSTHLNALLSLLEGRLRFTTRTAEPTDTATGLGPSPSSDLVPTTTVDSIQ